MGPVFKYLYLVVKNYRAEIAAHINTVTLWWNFHFVMRVVEMGSDGPLGRAVAFIIRSPAKWFTFSDHYYLTIQIKNSATIMI